MTAIREAVPSDFPRLLQIWEEAVKATHSFLARQDFEFFRSELQNRWLPALGLNVFVTAENIIAGFLGYQISGKELKIEALFVDPACFGKGIGRRLLDDIIRPDINVFIDVNEQNPQAMRFYEKYGFIVTGRSETDAFGRPYPLIHMRLGNAG